MARRTVGATIQTASVRKAAGVLLEQIRTWRYGQSCAALRAVQLAHEARLSTDDPTADHVEVCLRDAFAVRIGACPRSVQMPPRRVSGMLLTTCEPAQVVVEDNVSSDMQRALRTAPTRKQEE